MTLKIYIISVFLVAGFYLGMSNDVVSPHPSFISSKSPSSLGKNEIDIKIKDESIVKIWLQKVGPLSLCQGKYC